MYTYTHINKITAASQINYRMSFPLFIHVRNIVIQAIGISQCCEIKYLYQTLHNNGKQSSYFDF